MRCPICEKEYPGTFPIFGMCSKCYNREITMKLIPGEITFEPCKYCKRNPLKNDICFDCGSDNGWLQFQKLG